MKMQRIWNEEMSKLDKIWLLRHYVDGDNELKQLSGILWSGLSSELNEKIEARVNAWQEAGLLE